MKYFRYALIATMTGAFFALGVAIVVMYVLPMFNVYDPDAIYKDELARVEGELGKSCIALYEEAYKFTENEIGEIINQGLKGNDWIAIITTEQKSYIDKTSDELFECEKASFSASRLGLEWPSFNDINMLFSSLRTFSTRYGSGPATSRDLKPEVLDRVMFNYQNVTSR